MNDRILAAILRSVKFDSRPGITWRNLTVEPHYLSLIGGQLGPAVGPFELTTWTPASSDKLAMIHTFRVHDGEWSVGFSYYVLIRADGHAYWLALRADDGGGQLSGHNNLGHLPTITVRSFLDGTWHKAARSEVVTATSLTRSTGAAPVRVTSFGTYAPETCGPSVSYTRGAVPIDVT